MKKLLVIMAAMFCGAACGEKAREPHYPADTITTAEGRDLKITFFAHGSIAFEYAGRNIYVDPVSEYAGYGSLPKADVILVGHEHGDHLDPAAIDSLSTISTIVASNPTVIERLGHGRILRHGEILSLPATSDSIKIEAVPAYNTSPEKLDFHPRDRLHNGYVLTFGGTRVYVAGDTEDTSEMMALKDTDIAFLPVNLPYTMDEEQAARAVRAIKPKIFYPYHYGRVEHKTDLSRLETLLEGSGVEVRIRPLE